MFDLAREVVLADVTLREHGQNVPAEALHTFTVPGRVAIAEALIGAGIERLELLSCVSPRVAPAMAPALVRAVAEGVGRPSGTTLVTLVPNRQGLQSFRELGLGPDEFGHTAGLFFSAVEAHNQANLGRSIAATKAEYEAVAKDARQAGIPLVGYVSAAFGFRLRPAGDVIGVNRQDLLAHVWHLREMGAATVTLSDLQGVSTPERTAETLSWLLTHLGQDAARHLGYHAHHSDPGRGVALAEAAFDAGVRLLDASLGAAGGCVTGAPGNAPTEGVLAMLHRRGVKTGIDEAAVAQASAAFSQTLQASASP